MLSLNLQVVKTSDSVCRWRAVQAPGRPLSGPISMWEPFPPSLQPGGSWEKSWNKLLEHHLGGGHGLQSPPLARGPSCPAWTLFWVTWSHSEHTSFSIARGLKGGHPLWLSAG